MKFLENNFSVSNLLDMFVKKRESDENHLTPPSSPQHSRQPRSSPASPALSKKGKRNPSTSPIRHLLNSPLLNRKNRKKQQPESSDDESSAYNNDENSGKHNYRDLETFQKAQLRQKVNMGERETVEERSVSKYVNKIMLKIILCN